MADQKEKNDGIFLIEHRGRKQINIDKKGPIKVKGTLAVEHKHGASRVSLEGTGSDGKHVDFRRNQTGLGTKDFEETLYLMPGDYYLSLNGFMSSSTGLVKLGIGENPFEKIEKIEQKGINIMPVFLLVLAAAGGAYMLTKDGGGN